MAAAPLTYLEKKWAAGYANSNLMIGGATQTQDRKNVPMLDRDTQRNITPMGRRTLLTLGRWLYWNCSAVRGAINEMAELAGQQFIAQSESADMEWANQVEAWLYEHDKICDVRGWPFNMATYRKNLVRSAIVDGDIATLLTQTASGYPMIQVIPAHRIGTNWSSTGMEFVQGGPYDGARIIDGVIVDDQSRAIAYRVLGESIYANDFRDIRAQDMFLSFAVETPDQVRGISLLGASVFEWQDIADARRFELIAQKLGATIGMIETNETGEADKTKKLLTRSSTNFNTPTAGTQTALATTATETVDGVSVRYHRAGSGAKLEAYQMDRPSANQQMFRDDVIREALAGMGWSFDFSYNPTKAGGAQMRIVIDKINRKLDCLRYDLVIPAQTRIDGFRVAKAIKLGLLPASVDWWKWTYQGPAELTADEKYSSDVDHQERKSGRKTMAKSAAQRGDYWRDIRAQKATEADDLLTRATALAKKHKIAVETAIVLLQDMTSYSTLTNSADAVAESQSDGAAPAAPKEPEPAASAQPLHFNIDARGDTRKKRKLVIKRDNRGVMTGVEDE